MSYTTISVLRFSGGMSLKLHSMSKFLVYKNKRTFNLSNIMKVKRNFCIKSQASSNISLGRTDGGVLSRSILLHARRTVQPMFTRGFKMKNIKTEVVKEVPGGTKENVFSRINSRQQQNGSGGSNSEKGSGFWNTAMKTSMYTVGFSVIVFGGSAIWQQRNFSQHDNFWKGGLDKKPSKKRVEPRNELNEIWNHLSMVHKVTYGIMGANLLVLLGWKFVNPQVMMQWFTVSISNTSNQLSAMFLSMFSHKSFIHFYVNMYVLSSFCAAWNQMGRAKNSSVNGHERYLAFYITAGMCSGLLSLLVKTAGRIPNPSLGASGAIMGLIGYTCEKMPNNLLSIVFLPNWTFHASSAKNFIIGFDTLGLLIGMVTNWRYMIFDHAGHLGGMLFGIWYAKSGEEVIDRFCRYIMQYWKK